MGFMIAIAQNMTRNGKLFDDCIKKLLNLYAQWIRDFSIAIQEYAATILEVTFKFMKSSYVSSKVRELAAVVVHAMVEAKILPENEISNVLRMMLNSCSDSRNIKVYCEYLC